MSELHGHARGKTFDARARAACCLKCCRAKSSATAGKAKKSRKSLDLCLACKGCQSDCPMHVDMATYKAEFLSHYYKGKLRPRHAYAMGLIHLWARARIKHAGRGEFFRHARR